MKTAEEVREWAYNEHNSVGHKYSNFEYSYHLSMVASFAEKFKEYINDEDFDIVLKACYCHDILEDTRNTYNDLKKVVGDEVAEIAYALTNEKGRNRKERASDKYYSEMRHVPYACLVKLFDVCANMIFSNTMDKSMFNMYKKELPEKLKKLEAKRYPKIVEYLENL